MDTRKTVPSTAAAREGDPTVPYEPVRDNIQDAPETDQEAQEGGSSEAWQFWNKQLAAALVHERRFRKEAQSSEKMYFGPDNDDGNRNTDISTLDKIDDKVSLIHATVDVLRPLVYSDTPQPLIRRRFRGDGNSTDHTAMMSAEVGQRMAQFFIDTSDFDNAMMGARDDWLIAGRGGVRVSYSAEFADIEITDPTTGQPVALEVKTSEDVSVNYSPWERTLLAPASSWVKMPWLAFENPMTRKDIEDRFGEEKAANISFDTKGLTDASRAPGDDDRNRNTASIADTETGALTKSPFDTTMVWEIQNKQSGEVIWWCEGYTNDVLDRADDFLNLEKFYPCPKPLLAATKNDEMTPRPDIRYYENRASEIELATKKIRSILKAISISGLFPGTMTDEIKKILEGENQMVPVQEWIALMEKGGTANIIQWLPLQAMLEAINALLLLRNQAKDAMFEASGVSDVMRAQGDPNETATAQQIKGRYAGLRLAERQSEMAMYARDVIRLMLEIGLEHFDDETIADICGLELPMTEAEREQMVAQEQAIQQQYQQTMQVHQLAQQAGIQVGPPPPEPKKQKIPETSYEAVLKRLRDDFKRKITVTIETQSTVLADEQADKEARVEFLGSFATFVQQIAPMAQSGQFDFKVMKELLLFGVRGFPKSRTLESLISSMPDEPTGQAPEDTQVQVAKIRAEVDKLIKEMDMADNDKDRAQDLKLAGVGLVKDGAKMAADAANAPPPPIPAPTGAK